jgi:hypothetical protein
MKRLRACGALIAAGGPAELMLAIALAGAGAAFGLSQTMVLPKQLSVVKNP